MCTVTFAPRKGGYILAMNRDEKRSRATGLPPMKRMVNGRAVLAPSEPAGGTWISLNSSGVTFALINWYSIAARVQANPVSRGQVVLAASARDTSDSALAALALLPLGNINPFRLIGIFPATQEVFQWQWNLQRLVRRRHPWHTRQWISSGFDEPMAQRIRHRSFKAAGRQKTSGSLDWLRRLHSSHEPRTGPFSTCMHRADAATVSLTAIAVSGKRLLMRHWNGAPCEWPPETLHQISPLP